MKTFIFVILKIVEVISAILVFSLLSITAGYFGGGQGFMINGAIGIYCVLATASVLIFLWLICVHGVPYWFKLNWELTNKILKKKED